MASIKRRLYERAIGRRVSGEPVVGLGELVGYLWRRGAAQWLRGIRWRRRFGRCGSGLLLGRRVEIVFPRYISLGRGVQIGAYSFLSGLSTEGVKIGDNVRIREHVWIQATSELDHPGKGLVIGENTYIGPRCMVGAGGGVEIGCNVTFGAGIQVLAENHRFDDSDTLIRTQGVTRRGIVIEDDVWIGNGAIIVDGIRIGRGAVVGAGAIVTHDVAPYTVMAGNPARVIGHRGRQREAAGAPRGGMN